MDLADETGAEADSQNNLVAPLLQRVAADVQHFVKSCGYTRMPTRGEMREAGGSRTLTHVVSLLALTALQGACFSAIQAMHQALVALRCSGQLADSRPTCILMPLSLFVQAEASSPMRSPAVVALQQWLDTSDCLFLKLEGERGQE